MSKTNIDTIIFDLGGVLIDWNPRYLYRKIFKTEEAIEYFLESICTFDWNECQDGGRSISVANEILISKYPEYENEILSFYGRWTEMLGGEIPESVKLLMQIKESKKYQLVALTNWSAETFPMALERYNFLKCFENILVSGEEGVKKPDMAIYDLLCQKFNINPAKAIFIDDNERNIDAARSYGLNTILFNNPEDCKSELSKWIKLD